MAYVYLHLVDVYGIKLVGKKKKTFYGYYWVLLRALEWFIRFSPDSIDSAAKNVHENGDFQTVSLELRILMPMNGVMTILNLESWFPKIPLKGGPLLLLMAEILHQLIGSFSHYLQGSIHPRWCRISAINSSSHSASG